MYSDRIYVMHRGRIAAAGTPADVLRDDLIARVFECDLRVNALPPPGVPDLLPQSVARAGG